MNDPYYQGTQAHDSAKNPHVPGSEDYFEWADGYDDRFKPAPPALSRTGLCIIAALIFIGTLSSF